MNTETESILTKAKQLLKQYFGYEQFRTGQEELISHILNHEDVLGIMPTGAR
jgi:ATP-dependent DNA helicase RecQ